MNKQCVLCKGNMIFLLEKNGYSIYRCILCGLAQTDLGEDYTTFVKRHYDKGYFTGNPQRSAYVGYKTDKKYIVQNMSNFLQHVIKYKSSGKLLDVGCALGFFVELAMKKGFDAYGFDPSEYAVEEAKKLVGSDRIKYGTIGDISYAKKMFDVITLFDVFEHLNDPILDIKKLMSFLKDDGIIVIATGDTKSKLAQLLKRRWTFYIPPQHLFFFNKLTLSNLLAKSGLRVVEWFRIGKWLSLRYVLHLAKTTGESKSAKALYSLMEKFGLGQLPIFLPLRDNMVAIVKKIL